jgi:predicted ATPase
MGDLRRAKEYYEMASSIYDPERHPPLAFLYGGTDAEVACRSYQAWTLWQLGYPDEALKRGNQALTWAQGLSQPHSLAVGEFFLGLLYQYRREPRAVQEIAERAIRLCTEHGLNDYLAQVITLRGWAIASQGRHQEGIGQIEQGLAMSRATGAELRRPYFLCLLAQARMGSGCLDDGLSALNEALAVTEQNQNRVHEAEIHRVKGELLLQRNILTAPEAQRCFERAVATARKQNGKSLELRATTSLARLLDKQGHRDAARTMLAQIYNWFTEGFDTADLKEAKALLDEVSHNPGRSS